MANKGKIGYQLLCIALLAVIFLLVWQKKNAAGLETSVLGENAADVTSPTPDPTYILNSMVRDSFDLPFPTEKGGMPLQEALKNRRTNRLFSDKPLSDQQISDLLWSANGVNKIDGNMRTAPSSRNSQEIDIYLFTKVAVYKYDAARNYLYFVRAGDYRAKAGLNDFFSVAPIALVYVADLKKMADYDEAGRDFYSATDVGFVSQNVYLHCASENLATVVCGYISREEIANLLGISNGRVLLSQPVGLTK